MASLKAVIFCIMFRLSAQNCRLQIFDIFLCQSATLIEKKSMIVQAIQLENRVQVWWDYICIDDVYPFYSIRHCIHHDIISTCDIFLRISKFGWQDLVDLHSVRFLHKLLLHLLFNSPSQRRTTRMLSPIDAKQNALHHRGTQNDEEAQAE